MATKPINFWFENPLNIRGSVAIVGSSSLLLKQNASKVIDKFDNVIRFNRAPTENYEGYVGRKTTHRVVNPHVFKNMAIDKRFTKQPQYFVKDLRNTHIILIGPGSPRLKDKLKYTHDSNKLSRFKFGMIGDLKSIAGYANGRDPSVGYIMVCLCIVAGIKPTIFGFDYDKSCDPTKRSHYWEDRPPISGLHKASYEIDFLNKMKKLNKIYIYKE